MPLLLRKIYLNAIVVEKIYLNAIVVEKNCKMKDFDMVPTPAGKTGK